MTDGVRIIIKTYDGGNEEAMKAYEAELGAYKSLHALQGHYIPRLLSYGRLQDTCDPTLVLEHCGTSLEDMPSVTHEHLQAALKSLRALHRAGAMHGDITRGHMVMDPITKRVVLIGLHTVSFLVEDKKVSFGKEERRVLHA